MVVKRYFRILKQIRGVSLVNPSEGQAHFELGLPRHPSFDNVTWKKPWTIHGYKGYDHYFICQE
jgi:hypothetical protein